MKKWLGQNKFHLIGTLIGGIAGFMYWKYVGCLTGTCAITSNPSRSTLYFAVMGALLFGMFSKDGKRISNP